MACKSMQSVESTIDLGWVGCFWLQVAFSSLMLRIPSVDGFLQHLGTIDAVEKKTSSHCNSAIGGMAPW